MKTALKITAVLFLSSIISGGPCWASENERCGDPCGKPTAWEEFNAYELKMAVPGKPAYQSWRGKFDTESGDIQIELETSDGSKTIKGRILLFGGRVMAIQGPIVKAGYEIDALDSVVLQSRLVARLLGEVFPKGPTQVNGQREIDFKKAKTGIQFATPSAQGFIAPPWRVTGTVKALAPDDINFDLTLAAAGPAINNGRYLANFTGHIFKVLSANVDDAMHLEGWNLYELGVHGSGTLFDYSAAPASAEYRVVSDIRKKLAADDYPGEPDPSKNFTGFWKEDCEQAFGLQVMKYGKDGKYAVTFCGPGGCGTVGEDGKNTFITKDPDYEVVSESELKIRNANNGWDTHLRCARDTHPLLKYKSQ